MNRRLTLDEAEEVARLATQRELEKYDIPSGLSTEVVLTILFEGDDRVFVLYVPGETREDARVIAKTRVSLENGRTHVDVPVYRLKGA